MIATSKKCRECNHTLPLQDFYQHPAMADGYLNKCKECVKRRVRKYSKHPKVREQDRKRHRNKTQKPKPNTKQHNKASQKWAKKHPRKRQATVKIYRALKTGKIRRPKRCEDCEKFVFQKLIILIITNP